MANLITVGRVLLLFGAIGMIYSREYWLVILAGLLLLGIFAGDGLDGYVARRRNSSSKLGAVLDIAGDRVVENVLWVVFAELQMIGVWAPLVVLTRSFTVDVMRSVALEQGKTAFGESTMMRSRFSWFLTASRFSRVTYGWAKALGFFFLTWLFASRLPGADGQILHHLFDLNLSGTSLFSILTWITVYTSIVMCVVRGLPVVWDAMYYLREDDAAEAHLTPRDAAPLLPAPGSGPGERSERGEPA